MKYSFSIDEKSLYIGIKNDYPRGHSATVHTPLNQSKDKSLWHNDVYKFLKGCETEDKITNLPEELKEKCSLKTTSQAPTEVIHFFEFTNLSLDGVPFEVNASFAFFVKRELGKTKIGRDGEIGQNPHYMREKLHYPKTFSYKLDGYNIDNKVVLNKILKKNGGFAYIVKGFDYDTKKKILNFQTMVVGPMNILLSKVFKIQKGVGSKLLIDNYNIEGSRFLLEANEHLSPENSKSFAENLEKINKSKLDNGALGEKYVYENITEIFGNKLRDSIHTSQIYPAAPYDIEFILNGKRTYIEVKSTSGKKKYFFMSHSEKSFMDAHRKHYKLVLVTNVKSEEKEYTIYEPKEILSSSIMEQEPQGYKFTVINQ